MTKAKAPAKKPAAKKTVKVTANLKKAQIDEDTLDHDESGVLRLWGVDFAVKDGKATASVEADIAEAMKDAKLVK